MKQSMWEDIYARGEQLSRYPFAEVVSFYFRNRRSDSSCPQVALDVGCGSGVHSAFLAENGCEVLGIDFSKSAIIAAQEQHQNDNIILKHSGFEDFSNHTKEFDFVVDRCSTTHSTRPIVKNFYQNLKPCLAPGAKMFWQGFAWDNSGRELGVDVGDGSWNNFSGGVFKPLGRTAFFTEQDVRTIFDGYAIQHLRYVCDRDVVANYNHSSWIIEAVFDG